MNIEEDNIPEAIRLAGRRNWAICMWENQTESFREWDPFLGEISDGR